MQYHVEQAGCSNITFNESQIPVTQQMDNMYKYLKQEVNEAQLEVNTLSDVAESFFSPESLPGTTHQSNHWMRINLTSEQDDLLVLSQHLPLVQHSS